LLQRLIGEHIALQLKLAPELGRVRANQVQLEQVVMNLAINARDAMPDGGTLTIETRNVEVNGNFSQEQLQLEPGPYVQVTVTDTGHGMDAVTLASIFEPFFTTKEIGKGTGLGLATVYAIVHQAGGAIYAYSEPGHGSVFKVYLPRVDAPAVQQPHGSELAGRPDTRTGSPATILVVEDEPGVRAFTVEVLTDAGYRVLQAGNGAEALDCIRAHAGPVALLLTDVVMPDMNGRVLAERLRALYPGLAVLFTSGYTEDMMIRTGLAADALNFLQKPYMPQTLLDRVRAVLQRAATLSSNG
jgi:CheY-like chemotaxis protein